MIDRSAEVGTGVPGAPPEVTLNVIVPEPKVLPVEPVNVIDDASKDVNESVPAPRAPPDAKVTPVIVEVNPVS
jgi:hypothetical protein